MRIKVFAKVAGVGSPVIFLPGMGWTAESVWPFRLLQDRYTVHALDLPGLGRSAPLPHAANWYDVAFWVKSYCDSQGFGAVRLIGHSTGGVVALAFADQYPERVHQLVLLDAGYQKIPRFPTGVSKPLRYFTPVLSVMTQTGATSWAARVATRAVVRDMSPAGLEQAFLTFVHEQHIPITPSLRIAFYTAMQEVVVTPGGLAFLLAIYRSKPVQAFCRLKPPTLLVVPESMMNRRPLTAIDELGLPILLYEVSGGHYVHFAHPEIVGVVRDFFDHWA
ncbi:MAG: hypothetical protein C7B44_10455 [Sulfobacillus thermosulfidooxidans]|nr:MAG: hypothetical protein C7B44_10455 [Sulfobacillus thermosulfidooxidans]